ncbi:MAG TPA: hypothetical protein VH253_11350 [Phycisphaerae bacterium]|nr:hypothetical protein [Phycisphaerae bacterium]
MQISAIGHVMDNALALALFELLTAGATGTASANPSVAATCRQPSHIASKGVNAAFEAFENYVAIMDTQHQAMINGLATYALQPKGGALPVSAQEIAPFLALNVLA